MGHISYSLQVHMEFVRNNIIYQSPDKENIIPKPAAPQSMVQQAVNTSQDIRNQTIRVRIQQEI
jgi:hypothetical protein